MLLSLEGVSGVSNASLSDKTVAEFHWVLQVQAHAVFCMRRACLYPIPFNNVSVGPGVLCSPRKRAVDCFCPEPSSHRAQYRPKCCLRPPAMSFPAPRSHEN